MIIAKIKQAVMQAVKPALSVKQIPIIQNLQILIAQAQMFAAVLIPPPSLLASAAMLAPPHPLPAIALGHLKIMNAMLLDVILSAHAVEQ